MPIDTERLARDPDYWDEVAPPGATHYALANGTFGLLNCFYRPDPAYPDRFNMCNMYHAQTLRGANTPQDADTRWWSAAHSERPASELIPRPLHEETPGTPPWHQAPPQATHWDAAIDKFCNTDGYWSDGLFFRWGFDRSENITACPQQFIPRPGTANPIFYRYEDGLETCNDLIELKKFEVIKHTPQGYWVHAHPVLVYDKEHKLQKQGCKWISHDSKFARTDKAQAWKDYAIRKKHHLQHLRDKLDRIKTIRVHINQNRNNPPQNTVQTEARPEELAF